MEQQDGRPLATLRARLRRPKLTPVSLISMLFAGRMLPPDTAADTATVEHSSGACTWRLALLLLLLLLLLLNSLAQPTIYVTHSSRQPHPGILHHPAADSAWRCALQPGVDAHQAAAAAKPVRSPHGSLHPASSLHRPKAGLKGGGQALLRSSPAR